MPLVELHGEVKRAIFLARYSRELRPDALTGQAIDTLTLGANTATDVHGDTVATIANEPCWVYDSGEDKMFLELDSNTERLTYDFTTIPRAMGGLIEFIATATSGALLRIGGYGSPGAAPKILVDHDGSDFVIAHDNGSSSVNSAVTTAISAGSLYSIRWALNADGSVQIWWSKDGGSETAGSASGALALAAAWSGTLSVICTDNKGSAEVARVGLVAISADPDATLSELQNLF